MNNKIFKSLFCVTIFMVLICSQVFAGAWVKEGENWKYDNGDGTFVVSNWKFVQDGNEAYNYYFDANGYMVKGLQKIGNDYYLFDRNGRPVSHSKVLVDGREYDTRNKGQLQNVFGTLDCEAFNNYYFSEEAIALENEVKNEVKEVSESEAALQADLEKRGPKSRAANEMKKNEIGPGQGM